MSRNSDSRKLTILAGVVAVAAVVLATVLVLAITNVIPVGSGSRSPATYADGSSDTPPTDKKEGCPTDGTSLAGSWLKVTDPSGRAIVDTALDCNYLEQMKGDDQKYHLTPGILPGFWYLRDHYELPELSHRQDRMVLVGHTGPPEAHAPLTGMVGLPQLSSYEGFEATLTTPTLGVEQLGIQLAENIGNSDITKYLESAPKTPGERYVAGCRVVDGQIIDQTVIVKLVPIGSP